MNKHNERISGLHKALEMMRTTQFAGRWAKQILLVEDLLAEAFSNERQKEGHEPTCGQSTIFHYERCNCVLRYPELSEANDGEA